MVLNENMTNSAQTKYVPCKGPVDTPTESLAYLFFFLSMLKSWPIRNHL